MEKKTYRGSNLQHKERLRSNTKNCLKKKKRKKRKCQVHIRRLPLPYTQNSVPVIDNPRGPDFQHKNSIQPCSITFMAKEWIKRTDTLYIYIYVLTESVDCTLRITKLQIDYTSTQHWHEIKEKKKKSNAYYIPPTLLTCAAIPSLDPEQTRVPGLHWGGVETARQGPLHRDAS